MSTPFRDVQESGCMMDNMEWMERMYRQKIRTNFGALRITIGRRQDKTCNDKQPERFLLAKNN